MRWTTTVVGVALRPQPSGPTASADRVPKLMTSPRGPFVALPDQVLTHDAMSRWIADVTC